MRLSIKKYGAHNVGEIVSAHGVQTTYLYSTGMMRPVEVAEELNRLFAWLPPHICDALFWKYRETLDFQSSGDDERDMRDMIEAAQSLIGIVPPRMLEGYVDSGAIEFPAGLVETYVQENGYTEVMTYTRNDYRLLMVVILYSKLFSPYYHSISSLARATRGEWSREIPIVDIWDSPVMVEYSGLQKLMSYFNNIINVQTVPPAGLYNAIPAEMAVRQTLSILLARRLPSFLLGRGMHGEVDHALAHISTYLRSTLVEGRGGNDISVKAKPAATGGRESSDGTDTLSSYLAVAQVSPGDKVTIKTYLENAKYVYEWLETPIEFDTLLSELEMVKRHIITPPTALQFTLLTLVTPPSLIHPASIQYASPVGVITLMYNMFVHLVLSGYAPIAEMLISSPTPRGGGGFNRAAVSNERGRYDELESLYPHVIRNGKSEKSPGMVSMVTMLEEFRGGPRWCDLPQTLMKKYHLESQSSPITSTTIGLIRELLEKRV
jgi:hypothetical protein